MTISAINKLRVVNRNHIARRLRKHSTALVGQGAQLFINAADGPPHPTLGLGFSFAVCRQ